jgi:acyl carrier protein
MNTETVYPKVRAIVADVLVIDEDEVSLDSQLISDLGAESIDFLDLVFQLEKEFDIKIPRGQLEFALNADTKNINLEDVWERCF